MNYKQANTKNNLSAIPLWVMALDCDIAAYMYNSTSSTVKIIFGLTIFSGIMYLLRETRKLSITTRRWEILNSRCFRIGSVIVFMAIVLYTIIPSHIKCIISIIIIFCGVSILTYPWICYILYYQNKYTHKNKNDEIPPALVLWGTVIIVAIFLALVLVVCFVPYPHSNGESILQHLLM